GEPESTTVELMGGVADAAAAVGAPVLGGDLSRGGELSVAVTVVGRTPKPVRRTGAMAGDALWVTGWLGGARAALAEWLAGREPPPWGARTTSCWWRCRNPNGATSCPGSSSGPAGCPSPGSGASPRRPRSASCTRAAPSRWRDTTTSDDPGTALSVRLLWQH